MKRKKYFYDTIEKENEDWHNNKNPLVRLFYKIKFNIAASSPEIREGDLILDFGCGTGQLKRFLANWPKYSKTKIIGYDIDPKLTEIKDYKKLKPNVIFALDVFEHIPEKEIRKIIRNFKKMNPSFNLITAIPTETWLWHKMRKIMGLSEYVADHITPLKEILRILREEGLEVYNGDKINLFFMSYIAEWKWLNR